MKKTFFLLTFIMCIQLLFAQTAPEVRTDTFYTRGTDIAYLQAQVMGYQPISAFGEKGFCWDTLPNPTIASNKKSITTWRNSSVSKKLFFGNITDLKPNTLYYVRAYVKNGTGETGYGNEIQVLTLPGGNITYTLNRDNNPDNAAIFNRIEAAMNTAQQYYNRFTTINNKHLNVTYNSGVQTADANYAGNMRFGPNASYQRAGTALHETAHTVGVGQHSMWNSLRVNNVWVGKQANRVLRFMTGDDSQEIHGDSQHFWPYGINGAQEDDNNPNTYTINVMIVQGMFEDGLPGSNVPTASKIFNPDTTTVYYIKTEDATKNRSTAFLTDAAGTLYNRTYTVAQASADPTAAWKIYYNPQTCFYAIQNVGTGNFLKYTGTYASSSGHQATNLIKVQPMDNTAENRYWFQLVRSCNVMIPNAGTGDPYFTLNTYGIVMNRTNGFQSLDAYSTTGTGTWAYEAGKSNQQWSFLTSQDLGIVSATENPKTADNIHVYAAKGKVHIESASFENWGEATVFSIDGRHILSTQKSVFSLASGIYFIKIGNQIYKVGV